jgi:hypothetical protein
VTIEFVMIARHHRERHVDGPPVSGMSVEVWTWLREPAPVRPDAVAEARARLDAGDHPTPTQLAEALLEAAV